MARCARCQATMLIGKVSIGEDRFCTANCAFQHFYPRLQLALVESVSANPSPFGGIKPSDAGDKPSADDFSDPLVGESPGESLKDLWIILCGILGMIFTAVVIRVIHQAVNYPFYAQTFLFVIPVGAFFCGLVGGWGFFTSIRKFDRRPGPLTYIAAGLSGLAGYLLIFFLMWWTTEIEGQKVRDAIPFQVFLQYIVENQAIQVGRFGQGGKPIELGKLGYARFAINLLGFIGGAIVSVSMGGEREYCRRCRRYFKGVETRAVSTSDPVKAGQSLHLMISAIVAGRFDDALRAQTDLDRSASDGYLHTKIVVEACPSCGKHKGTLTVSVPDAEGRKELGEFNIKGYGPAPAKVG